MAELQFETVIQRPAEDVFALIADLPNYDQWLPPSNLYGAVTQYSELPAHAGTQYVDQGRMSRMTGVVTEFEPPTRIANVPADLQEGIAAALRNREVVARAENGVIVTDAHNVFSILNAADQMILRQLLVQQLPPQMLAN